MSILTAAHCRQARHADHTASLPGWPLIAAFAAYQVWWWLGVGDFIWIIAALVLVGTWVGVCNVRVPVVFLVWGLFLAWVLASITMTDTPGRAVGALYRWTLYASAAVFALHIFNARSKLRLTVLTGTATAFLASATVGGILAMAAPLLVVRTPMAYVMPRRLMSNELVRDMVIRRTTQWVEDSWADLAVRPSAPFLYTNTWGNVYSLLLPLALLHLWLMWRTRWRWPVLSIILISAIPAQATLNRGMYIGLFVVALWVGLQALRRGRVLLATSGALALAVGAAGVYLSPAGQALMNRVSTTNSTEDRYTLYVETLRATMESPLLGWGAPRPAAAPWMPSLGTQGQLWTTVFSHGFVGLALFLGFLLAVLAVAWRRTDPVGAVLGGIVAATLVETLFYGMSTGLMVTMFAVGLLLRGDRAPAGSKPTGADAPRAVSSLDSPGKNSGSSASLPPRGGR